MADMIQENELKWKSISGDIGKKAMDYANRIDCLYQGEMFLTWSDLEDAYTEGYNQCIEDVKTFLRGR